MSKRKSKAAKAAAEAPEVEGLGGPELRDLLRLKLEREGRGDLALILESCASLISLPCVCCSETIVVERGCKRRWCPVCAPRVSAARIMRVESIAERFQWPLAVTLTRKNQEGHLEALAAFKDAFTKFRRTRFWSDNVKGGVVGYEVTLRDKGFHPHLHALVDCEWLAVTTPKPTRRCTKDHLKRLCQRAQEELSEVWGAYVQGSAATVWVNRAFGNSLLETLKYSVKPADLLAKATRAGDLIDMIDAGRTMSTFGHAHATSAEFVGRDLPEENLKPCAKCGAFKSLLPDDIASMYEDRPDLATARYHRLMSLAANRDDPNKTWQPLLTVPDIVPKGRSPSPIRAEAEAAKAAHRAAQETEKEQRAAERARKMKAAEEELERQKATRTGGRIWTPRAR